MRPMIVLRRCDAKPAEDPNTAELTEDSSDEEEEDCTQRRKAHKKCFKKSTPVTQGPDRGSDEEATSDEEIQQRDLLLEVTVLTDSGDEEGVAYDKNRTCPFEDFEIKLYTEGLYCDEKRETISDRRKSLRRKVSCSAGGPSSLSAKSRQGKETHDCSECGISLFSKSDLKIHKTAHSAEHPFECTECGTAFKYKTNLCRHMKIHRRTALSGDAQVASTSQTAQSTRHDKDVTSPWREATCSVSREVYSESSLASHMRPHKHEKDTHEDTCELCQATFSSKAQLKEHLSSHKRRGKLQCPGCSKTFDYYSELKRHMVSHKFTSREIQKRLKRGSKTCVSKPKSMGKHKGHRLPHKTKNTFNCSVCGKRYEQKSSLHRHQMLLHGHTNEKKDSAKQLSGNASSGKQRCSMCQKEFLLMVNFLKHVLCHKTKSCLICGKLFSRPFMVRRHMKVHTGEKPVSCPVCKKRFADKTNMANHVVSFHQR